MVDMERVVREALDRAQNAGIVFIDEIDKIAGREGGVGPDVSRGGVQRDLLPIVEGSNVNTKYGVVKTDHVLFIAAGAARRCAAPTSPAAGCSATSCPSSRARTSTPSTAW